MKYAQDIASDRVKCLSFHPKFPWLLSGLHSGLINLYDYQNMVIIQSFSYHTGPVRSVHFHPKLDLFVSGSDDMSIVVWNYMQSKPLFSLKGHVDYIRSVEFHNTLPWILSTSDDGTIRVWNWQNRQCISILAGHTNYVMYAKFHPKEDYLASCSLDGTIRLWDYSALMQKNQCLNNDSIFDLDSSSNSTAVGIRKYEISLGAEIVGTCIVEAHERGINHISFNENGDYLITSSDDKTVTIWSVSLYRCKLKTVLYGHSNNVNFALMHDYLPLLVSCSEDCTVKLWNYEEGTCIHTVKDVNERYWTLSINKDSSYIATGHDSGARIYSFVYPSFVSALYPLRIFNDSVKQVSRKDYLFYYNPYTKSINLSTPECAVYSIKLSNKILRKMDYTTRIANISVNLHSNQEILLLIAYYDKNNVIDTDKKTSTKPIGNQILYSYDLVIIPMSMKLLISILTENQETIIESRNIGYFTGLDAVFIARRRLALLLQCNKYCIITINDTKTINSGEPLQFVDALCVMKVYSFKSMQAIIWDKSGQLKVFDFLKKKVLVESIVSLINTPPQIYYTKQHNRIDTGSMEEEIAIVCTHDSVEIMNFVNMQKIKTINDICLSGTWLNNNTFIYLNNSNIKYITINPTTTGTIKALSKFDRTYQPIALKRTQESNRKMHDYELYMISSNFELITEHICLTELLLKVVSIIGQKKDMMTLLSNIRLSSEALLKYVINTGYYDIAYQHSSDPSKKIYLATQFGDTDTALDLLNENVKSISKSLATKYLKDILVQAKKQGLLKNTIQALRRLNNFKELTKILILSGNLQMLKLDTDTYGEKQSLDEDITNNILSCNITRYIENLIRKKQYKLAYATAITYEATEFKATEFIDTAFNSLDINTRESIRKKVNQQNNKTNKLLFPKLPCGLKYIDTDFCINKLNINDKDIDKNDRYNENDIFNISMQDIYEKSSTHTKTDDSSFSSVDWNEKNNAWESDSDESDKFNDNQTFIADPKSPITHTQNKAICLHHSALYIDYFIIGLPAKGFKILQMYLPLHEDGKKKMKQYVLRMYLGARIAVPLNHFVKNYHICIKQDKRMLENNYDYNKFIPYNIYTLESHKKLYDHIISCFTNKQLNDLVKFSSEFFVSSILTEMNASTKDVLENQLNTIKDYVIMSNIFNEINKIREKVEKDENESVSYNEDRTIKMLLYSSYIIAFIKPLQQHIAIILKQVIKLFASVENYRSIVQIIQFVDQSYNCTDNITFQKLKSSYLQKSEAIGTNLIEVEDLQNIVNNKLCCKNLMPIIPLEAIECSYCGANYHKSYYGDCCQICNLVTVGASKLALKNYRII